MTIYPEWIKVKCPVCNAMPYVPCEAAFNLPKGTTLSRPHNARFIAYEQTQSSNKTNEKIRDSREVLSPKQSSDGTKSNRTT